MQVVLGNRVTGSRVYTADMRWPFSLLAATILTISLALEGQAPPPETPPPTLDELARAVLFLQAPETPKAGKSTRPKPGLIHIGTGFLVELDSRPFLVTAEHVAKRMGPTSSVTFAGDRGEPVTIALPSLVGDRPIRWVVHDTADVAVLPLRPAPDVERAFLPRALPPRYFSRELAAPPRNRPLTTIGFPLGLGAIERGPDDKLSPLSRESKPASGLITLNRFDTKKPSVFFLLDSPTIGGFSGSPALITPGSFSDGPGLAMSATVLCVGLVHGTIQDEQGGLAAIVPASFIVETLEKALASDEAARFRLFR